jgi:hypothetical protein
MAAYLTSPPDHWYQTHAHMSRLAVFWLWHSLASSTRTSYTTGQCSFFELILSNPQFCHPSGSILPVTNNALLEWVARLGSRSLQPKAIKSYIAHLCSAHINNDLEFNACESPLLQRMVCGIKRYMGERDRKPKLPITFDILCLFISLYPSPQGVAVLNYTTAIRLAVTAFLRCGEFTVCNVKSFDSGAHLTQSCVRFEPSFNNANYIVLTIPSSKTDPLWTGVVTLHCCCTRFTNLPHELYQAALSP